MKLAAWISVAIVLAGAGAFAWLRMRTPPPAYLTSEVKREDVARYVVTTGNVNPVLTVQVGTYVSGPIKAIYCDYNTQVKAGQLCAKIDPRTYRVALDQAQANLASAVAQLAKDRATLAYTEALFARDQRLHERGIVSQEALDSDRSARDQAAAQTKLDEATITQRRAEVEAAQVNLDYTNILSPVDGTVVSRNVSVGQTVAASFQTPTLFLIAQDLTKMQVDTNVSEADVGQLHVGQPATFTVDAYANHPFAGVVSQIRKAPISVQNVITYDAVISVDNTELLLYPGMTANARIETAERKGVLTVPTQALQFRPSGTHDQEQHVPEVYVLRNGRPVATQVHTGLEGPNATEVSGALTQGERVITGEQLAARSGNKLPTRSPFAAR